MLPSPRGRGAGGEGCPPITPMGTDFCPPIHADLHRFVEARRALWGYPGAGCPDALYADALMLGAAAWDVGSLPRSRVMARLSTDSHRLAQICGATCRGKGLLALHSPLPVGEGSGVRAAPPAPGGRGGTQGGEEGIYRRHPPAGGRRALVSHAPQPGDCFGPSALAMTGWVGRSLASAALDCVMARPLLRIRALPGAPLRMGPTPLPAEERKAPRVRASPLSPWERGRG